MKFDWKIYDKSIEDGDSHSVAMKKAAPNKASKKGDKKKK